MSRRRRNKLIEEICSLGSSLTMMAMIYLLAKYHQYWQVVLVGIAVFLICVLLLALFVSRLIRLGRIEKAMNSQKFDSMTGEQFEEFCANLLRGNGYQDVTITPATGDHGIDVLAKKDGVKYAIQCKRYSKAVGNKAIQEAYSGRDIYGADVAVVMTNMDFTNQAEQDAKKLNVQLWGREIIYTLQKRGSFSTSQINEHDQNNLVCPKCGGELVVRTAKRGTNAGSQFYGCSNYPNCKYTRNI